MEIAEKYSFFDGVPQKRRFAKRRSAKTTFGLTASR
jgi:hypothetical protein